MDVHRTSADERDAVLGLYAHASALQRSKGQVEWPAIDTALVEREIEEGRQWHLRIDGRIACVWVVAYEDPQIWGDMDADPSVFLHRIATAPEFRGRRLVGEVVAWAIDHARDLGRTHLRLDTVGHNEALIRLYTSHGSPSSARNTWTTSAAYLDTTPMARASGSSCALIRRTLESPHNECGPCFQQTGTSAPP